MPRVSLSQTCGTEFGAVIEDYVYPDNAMEGCFHESTEFVTSTAGVKTVSQLQIGDEIRVWNPAANEASFSPVIAWWIRPSTDESCDKARAAGQSFGHAASLFVRVNYTASGLPESFTVTHDHNLEIACRSGQIRSDADGPPPAPNHCLVKASSVVVGDRLAIWDELSSSLQASNVSAIEKVTGGSVYTPLTQLGMNFLLNGGALVPMDGKAAVLPGSLPNSTIPRAYVVGMASFGLQLYAAMGRLMPESWKATLLAQETSIAFGSCIETVHLSNLLLQAINTSSSFSNILSVVGNGAGLATWAASNLCDVLPDLCTSGSESVSISQSSKQAALTELSINTQAGDLIDLRPLRDPFVWLNERPSSAPTDAASPSSSPPNGLMNAGTITGIVVGAAVLFFLIGAAAFWVIKSKRSAKVVAAA